MKTLSYLLMVIIVFSCGKKLNNQFETYLTYKWGNDSTTFIENGFVHSFTHFDTVLNKMVGDTLFPIERIDSFLIFTQIVEKGNWDFSEKIPKFTPTSDTLVLDTVIFKFRNLYGSKLFFYDKDNKYVTYYKLLETDKDVKLDKFDDRLRFEIAGYSIGDTISRDLIDITDIKNFDEYSLEVADLKSNKNIEFEIIGDSIIYNIFQREISDSEVDDIVKVIRNKFHQEPEYSPKKTEYDYEFEHYYWSKSDISIVLQKMTHIGKRFYSSLNASVDNWTILYQDNFMSDVLIDEFGKSKPKSLIIK